MTAPLPTITMHLEAGYDSNGGVLINAWPQNGSLYVFGGSGNSEYMIRVAGGQMTVFDQNGNVISPTPPFAGVAPGWPLGFLGANPGATVLRNLVVPNIQTHAAALNAALSTSGSTATLQVTYPSGATGMWTYVQSGSNWVAQSLVRTPVVANGSAPHTIQIANVNWNENQANDLARAKAGSTASAFPSRVSTSPGSLPTPTPDASPTATGDTFTVTNCNTNVYNWGGSRNILFMHGFDSSSCAWGIMANWLNNDFLFGNEAVPSLDSNDGLTVFGQDLASETNSVGGNNYILVAHSMGGLASRYAAQYFQNLQNTTGQPSPVNGVVTVDTPHEGADAALSLQAVTTGAFVYIALDLWQSLGCNTSLDNAGCYFAALMAGTAGYTSNSIYSAASPSFVDLTPGSTALNNLNGGALIGGASENFNQAAIIGYTPWQWDEVRWLDEFLVGKLGCDGPQYCCLPTDACGEDAAAAAVGYFWDALIVEWAFLEFEEWTWCDEFDYDDPYCVPPPFLQQDADEILQWIVYMEEADLIWNTAVSGLSFSSDAFVQTSSQYYPASTASQYPIYGSESHSGTLKSQTDHQVLYSILANPPFNVPTQSSCSFAVTNSPDSFSGNGGSDSFRVNTGAGCNWAAVSQNPWITVTSGINGTSTGTVDFSVAANPLSTPQQGAIQVGNGTSSVFFQVDEGAVCSYGLSQGPIVAAPQAGGSSTVQVTTSPDCPWSAVSNANWLTITAGPSGTGTGSFTWSAAPNAGSGDRTGTITVMNQTLVVVDGTYSGTPGYGTVTISSGPGQDLTFYTPCYHCVTLRAYQSGTISITVSGQTYTASFSGSSPTATLLASALTAAINNNAASPVFAINSGTTIYIIATQNGSATDYPLTTSVTFNQNCPSGGSRCFSLPAFSATPSGSTLTGGTP